MNLTKHNKASWMYTLWLALEDYRQNSIPAGIEAYYDAQWDEITTAMAWISEELEIKDID